MDEGAEDIVFYAVLPDFLATAGAAAEAEEEAAAAGCTEEDPALLARLDEVRRACLAVAAPLVQDYVWQYEQFDLQVARSSVAEFPLPIIHGQTRYGHNVEDAWFVVYLLQEISRKLPDISVRVWDSDGELLLIEAAYEIPVWLESENSRNRVFIRQGQVHILPLPNSPDHIGLSLACPSLMDAVRVLASGKVQTKASDAVQASICRRLSGYPQRARSNMHRVRCRVPLPVAQVLKHEPQMVALAVEAFYRRYRDDLVAASKMEKFLSRNSDGDEEMVTVLVTMSRAMYAQLKLQVFHPPRVYPMRPVNAQGVEDEIGMKLACGFEMMYAEHARFGKEQQQQQQAGSLERDEGWQAFRKSLEKSGYFRGLLEGSKEHRELTEAALARYKQTERFARVREMMQAPVKRVDEVLAMEHRLQDFPAASALPQSDADSWLYSGEDELNSAMREGQVQRDEYELRQQRQRKGHDIVEKMKAFVDKVSSFEGAEVPEQEGDVSVDVEKLFRELQTTVGEQDMEELGSDEDEEEDFMEEYNDVLREELEETSVGKTFAAHDEAAAAGKQDEEAPMNVDFNLVNNLLESFSSQQGLPGPASNVLGLMGMQLGDEDRKRNAKS